MVASIGTVGDSYDNAMAESVIGLYKTECVRHEGPWRGVDDLELGTLNWVWWFNTIRLRSEIGYVPPIEFENAYDRQINTQPQPRLGEPSLYQTRGASVAVGPREHRGRSGLRKPW